MLNEYINKIDRSLIPFTLVFLFLNKYINPKPALTHKPETNAPKCSPPFKNNSVIITEEEQLGIIPIIADNNTDK